MQRFGTPLQGFGRGAVIGGNVSIEVPAVIVERALGAVDQSLNIGRDLVFQVVEADDDIGHLNAGVVDVVLHLDLGAHRPEHADERVAEDGVPKVADVGRLVRIDVGVLDDDLARGSAFGFAGCAGQQAVPVQAAVEPNVDIPVSGHFHRSDAGNGGELG